MEQKQKPQQQVVYGWLTVEAKMSHEAAAKVIAFVDTQSQGPNWLRLPVYTNCHPENDALMRVRVSVSASHLAWDKYWKLWQEVLILMGSVQPNISIDGSQLCPECHAKRFNDEPNCPKCDRQWDDVECIICTKCEYHVYQQGIFDCPECGKKLPPWPIPPMK